jgi:hypothetical protein
VLYPCSRFGEMEEDEECEEEDKEMKKNCHFGL